MEPREIVVSHLELCGRVHDLLLEENTWLKTEKTAPTAEFLSCKQEILPSIGRIFIQLKKTKTRIFLSI